MKKSLLALAVLGAFAGAAVAQSSVTIYGKLDLGLVKANDGASILTGGPSNDELQLAQQAGSRLGFRGTEDLGGGLRANFGFEHRFTPDNGAADSTFWQGFSWVGLSGGFGELRLGRDYSPYFWTNIAADPWGYDTVGQIGMVHTASAVAVVSRYSNLISYRTPNLSGLTAQVAVGLAEQTNDTKDNVGFNVEYRGGPLYVGFGFHQGDSAAGMTGLATALGTTPAALGIVAGDKGTSMGITASYNFGVARLIGAYSTAKAEATTAGDDYSANNWSLAVSAPVGGGDLRAMYTRLTGKDLLDGIKNTKFGLGYHYPLSKRTKVYADIGSAKTTSLDRRTAYDFGIQHNF
ncbi:porin [Caldimonas sp.]|uniref:porin n=1 Tax=Caldimonas sp. TaxID=2838790 RepID=UPI00391A4AB9